MLEELVLARADGRLPRLMAAWARIDVLLLDDFGLVPLTAAQAADLLEVIEDRAGRRATIVTSQLPVAHWHEALGEPTIADAILDRLVHNAHRLELHGESMRRPRDERPGGPGTAATAGAPDEPERRVQTTRSPAEGGELKRAFPDPRRCRSDVYPAGVRKPRTGCSESAECAATVGSRRSTGGRSG